MEIALGGLSGTRVTSTEARGEVETEAAAAVQEVCASALFQKSPVLRELLLFLWRNRGNSQSEYQIGVEVLGRKPDFDPKNDATVRVNIARLRQRLRDYYEGEGANARLRVSIPLGVHALEVTRVTSEEAAVEPEPVMAAPQANPFGWFTWKRVAIAALCCLVLQTAYFLFSRGTGNPGRPSLHPFWTKAFPIGGACNLIMPSPQFFRWRQQGFVIRDFKANSYEAMSQSPYIEPLREKYGQPETSQLYTVTTDTLAAGEIARHLQDRGVSVDILTKSIVPPAVLESRNAILMFAPTTAAQYEPLIHPLRFRFDGGRLVNTAPQPNEPSAWIGKGYAQDHSLSYGLLAVIPSRSEAAKQLLLISSQNSALAAMLTTNAQLQSLYQFWQESGAPEFFEMVIQYENRDMTVLRAEAVAMHAWTRQARTPKPPPTN